MVSGGRLKGAWMKKDEIVKGPRSIDPTNRGSVIGHKKYDYITYYIVTQSIWPPKCF